MMGKNTKKKPFVLGINGSPHKEGTVIRLLNLTLKGARKAGAETKVIHLYEYRIEHETGLYSENPKKATMNSSFQDDMALIVPDVIRADAIVFGTPVYWANMSGAMKDFIDRLTPLEHDGFLLVGKLACVIAASKENEGGRESAAMTLVSPLMQMGFLLPPGAVRWYPGTWTTTKGKTKSWAEEDSSKVGTHMVYLINLLRKHPIRWFDDS